MNRVENLPSNFRLFLSSLKTKALRLLSKYTDSQARHWRRIAKSAVEKYWSSGTADSNAFMLEVLSEFNINSLLELGSNCGPRLYAIHRRWPEAKLEGIDINPYAVSFGNEKLQQIGIDNVRLSTARIEQIDHYPALSFDVCFSWAALMYLRPASVTTALRHAHRIARKAVVLFEMHSDALAGCRALGELCGTRNWKRNYRQLFSELGVETSGIEIYPIPLHVWSPGGGGGACIIVRR